VNVDIYPGKSSVGRYLLQCREPCEHSLIVVSELDVRVKARKGSLLVAKPCRAAMRRKPVMSGYR
jgi:hypothetical protein